MNTPAHLILGAAVFARPDATKVTIAALFGALAPDLSLYLMAGWHLFILQTPPEIVFGQLYFSDEWMRVFRVDNSFLIWGALLALAIWRKSAWGVALCGSALLHIALDFPLHHDDGRPHFWPLSNWIFDSPVSYWDQSAYGWLVGPLEIIICLIACGYLWTRFTSLIGRILIAVATLSQLLPGFIWLFVFDG